MYGYEWTDEYGIFRLTIEANLEKEIRPVFKEELDYFHMNQYWQYPDTDAPILWAEGIRRYILNGECVAEALGGGFYTKPTIKVHKKDLELHAVDLDRLWAVNASLITGMEQRAVRFIQSTFDTYKAKGFAFTVGFSGGKDSLALLDLVAKALAPSDFHVVFSNTGMELSDTLAAIEKAKAHWPQLDFQEAKCHMSPEESWDEFGPPGRRLRWCCAVHKSVPTILKMREITGDYDVKAVVFDGVRAEESLRRSKYDEISVGAKNINQVNCSPILKWNTAELFIYILHNGILLNQAYRFGLNRVGCTVCPLSSPWRDSMTNAHYPEDIKPLLDKVVLLTKNKVTDTQKYLEANGWRTRMGGRDLENGGNRVAEVVRENHYTLQLSSYTQDWPEVAKVLGASVDETEDGTVQSIKKKLIQYTLSTKGEGLTVDYAPYSKMDKYDIAHLKCVANKVAYCVGCKACSVQCPTGAFIITAEKKIHIRTELCTHCYNCLTFTDKGCIVAKSISTTAGGNTMDMKGMNCYQTFGFRQQWLSHFATYGIDCLYNGVLGGRQNDALKIWLKHSGLIETEKGDKTGSLTELGKMLQEKFMNNEWSAYDNVVWAIIWCNLAYKSVICRWFMYNVNIDDNFGKNDFVELIGDEYAKRTRENAVSSLCDTLASSPIGSALQQGIQLPSGNSYTYMRTGWERPEALVILYALYLYAEATGRYTFTLSQLTHSKDSADSKGVNPADIFGIDTKTFRDILQGLTLAYADQKYVRASFVGDLDNITLRQTDDDGKPITSLTILDMYVPHDED